ncbi:MAG: hypothetical protein LUG58_02495 [Clostridiales bacterium]|nr:hypothetical protein [Clostridiales bacterium]
MACFLVPAAEAAVVTIAAHSLELAEQKKAQRLTLSGDHTAALAEENPLPWSRKLKRLTYLLWGGVLLLAFEHVWHGEVTPWFPFLTAASNPADMVEMFHEMATVGVTMAVIVTAVWGVLVACATLLMKRSAGAELAR